MVSPIARNVARIRLHNGRLGVKSRAFHLGDYRRAHMGPGKDVPHDYFFVNGMDSYGVVRAQTLC